MGKITKRIAQALCCALTMAATSVLATPPTDDVTKAEGCIDITGGKGMFTLAASFDVGTGNSSGSLKYVDTAGNFTISSSSLVDYSYLDSNVRGFVFNASGANYNEVRVFVADWGSNGDQFEIQLLQNGTIVYDKYGTLSADCTGGGINGVVIGSNYCPPCDKTGKPPKKDKPPKNVHVKGNNGVGNGIDPQPPGNPPINDGPGTGPGNPGNRGGANQ